MNCPSCAHENRANAKFCDECGAPQQRACASCGVELRPAAKFCDECGAAIAGTAPGAPATPAAPTTPSVPPAADGARKIVTIVFADLVGSTALHERLDPESARHFMESYYAAARSAVESHGGTVTQLLGDGVKAVFGIPRVAEDDALRAVRAAVAMQEAFQALAEQQRGAVGATGLRVAVNTGEVVAKDETEIIGDPVNVAARLQEQGRDGDVVVGQSTHQLVDARITLELLGSFTLKGRAEPVRAYRVVSLDAPAGAAAAAFVGRDEELARIAKVYERAVARPATALAVLVGSPGLGKSRLIEEFTRRSNEVATVVTAHCDAAGGATFAPLAEALRAHLGLDAGADAPTVQASVEAALTGNDTERTRIAGGIAGLLTGSPAAPEETFFVIRRFFAGLAATRPVVLVIDDLQWAEPLLLDFVEHLVEWGSDVRLLVLVGARPELRELRATLVMQGGLVADVVTLGGLDAGAATRLAANVVGAVDLPTAVAAKVLATSEGNPLFIGELVRMLVHEGALTREGDRWIIGTALATLEMPPTIHALLAARIERLPLEERAVLERAAVVGRQFSRSAVAELLPRGGADLDARLQSLQRSELIERDTGWLLGEPVLRFHHVLIRDAAYRRILKGTRAELHARLADWMEERVGDAAEHDETIGRHLEQAHRLLGELGPFDAAGRTLGERASTRLAAAGRAALGGDDVPLAANLLGRALHRLDKDDAARADLALDWCEALLAAGDVGPAAAAIEELDRFTAGSERLQAWHTCFAGQHAVMTAPEALDATADAVAAAATALAAQDDAAGEAKAHFVYALALSRLGKVGACEAALDQALAAARRAGDRRCANTVLAIAPLAALWGPSPVTRASGRCLDVVRVLRITQGAPAVEAVALSCQGVLEALRGRTDAARRMIASARKMVEELGITQRLLETDVFAGLVALLEGDAAAAERSLRGAYDGLRELGLGINAAQAAALLARALLAQDRAADAEALSHESEELAGDDLKAAIAWRGVRAEALARRGEHAAAVELAQKGVEIAATTDALLDHADARLALAAALRAAGRGREADAEERRASELWETKGATLLGEQAQRDRASVEDAPAAPTLPNPSAPPAKPAARHRLQPNAATAANARFDAAIAAGNFDVVRSLFSHDYECIDHLNAGTFGRDEAVDALRRWYRSENPSYSCEPLATLGPSLMLGRRFLGAGGLTKGRYDVGEYEHQAIELHEVNESGLSRRSEIFAVDHFGDAIVRLFERAAELLPAGPARERAATAARSTATFLTRTDMVLGPALAPEIEVVDHRTVGFGTLRGAQAALDAMGALFELAENNTIVVEDVLALGANGFVHRSTHSGTLRDGGGIFERCICSLLVFGADGRVARYEQWDAEREAEALARYDELLPDGQARRLTAGAPEVQRRVQPNVATAMYARGDKALAARDFDAYRALFSDGFQEIHHPTGSSYGPDEGVAALQRLFEARDPSNHVDPLATLGPSLALARCNIGASGITSRTYDVGAYEYEAIQLMEVDERSLFWRSEVFAADHLGRAIARLYERYADLLPAGPARERAGATARAIAIVASGFDIDRFTAAFASDIYCVDHRHVGVGSLRGEEVRQAARALLDLTEGYDFRVDDVIGLSADTILTRQTNFGTDRASGGAFERVINELWVFGADGRITRWERFDLGHEAAAIARFEQLVPSANQERTADALTHFDALTGGATPEPPPRFANGAWQRGQELMRRSEARDWAGVACMLAPEFRFDDRRRLNRIEVDRDAYLVQTRMLFDQPGYRFGLSFDATRGDRLTLGRSTYRAEVEGGGPLELPPTLSVFEWGADGIGLALVLFNLEDEDAAYAELDARYDAGEGAEAGRNWTAIRSFVRGVADKDWDAVAALCAESFVEYDHRSLATLGTTRGGAAWAQNFSTLADLAPDTIYRCDHFLHTAHGYFTHGGWHGSREGGRYEIPLHAVLELDTRGLMVRADIYDDDGVDAALARFGELAAPAAPPEPFANAATRLFQGPMLASFRARDWTGFTQCLDPNYRFSDRRRLVRIELDREGFVQLTRALGDMSSTSLTSEALATRGNRLSLHHAHIEVADADVGPSDLEHLNLFETNERGDAIVAHIRFDADDLDAAYAELDARWEAGEGGPGARTGHAYSDAIANHDWDALSAIIAPDFVSIDSRRLALLGTTRDGEAHVQSIRALADLAPNATIRLEHIRRRARTFLWQGTYRGTHEGAAFEFHSLGVDEIDEQGRPTRRTWYDVEQLAEARTRFDELTAVPDSPRPRARANAGSAELATAPPARRVRTTAATRNLARQFAAIAAHDTNALMATLSERLEIVYHPTGSTYGAAEFVTTWRQLFQTTRLQCRHTPLGVLGASLALAHASISHAGTEIKDVASTGPVEMDQYIVIEVDEHGRAVWSEAFADNSLGAAIDRLYARYAERLPDGPARERAAATARVMPATLDPDKLDRLPGILADDLEVVDHRILGTWNAHGADEWRVHIRSVYEVAEDMVLRDDDVLALEPDALLVQRTHSGTERVGGGIYERTFIALMAFGYDGMVTRWELFDVDRAAEALARFAEFVGGGETTPATARFANAATRSVDRDAAANVPRTAIARPESSDPVPTTTTPNAADATAAGSPPAPFANAATRTGERAIAAMAARDWPGFMALFAADHRDIDRRGHSHVDLDREQLFAALRPTVEMTTALPTHEVLATRGERLALARAIWQGAAGDVGPSEIEWLTISEVDERGNMRLNVTLDPDDLDAAYVELDARYADSEDSGTCAAWLGSYSAALERRDWEALTDLYAATTVGHDHRLVGWGTLRGPAAFLESMRAMFELAPDARMRAHHVRTSPRGLITDSAWTGTRDGGAFESPFIGVIEFDAHGKAQRSDFYDPHHLAGALARFDAINARTTAAPRAALARPNAASAAMDRWMTTFETAAETDDWEPLRRLATPEMVFEDRRRLMRLSGDLEMMIASARERVASGARPTVRLLGTAGDRVAIRRVLWSGGPADGRFEIEYDHVAVVDEGGLLSAMELIDIDDPLAALRAAWRCWAAIDPVAKPWVDLMAPGDPNSRDPDEVRAVFAEDLVVDDHRRTGIGRVDGRDAYFETVAVLWELAPDTSIEFGWHWPAYDRHAALTTLRRTGTIVDGGPFESDYLALHVMGPQGLVTRLELFEIDALDTALRRFEELRPDPLRIPPTAATRLFDGMLEAWEARDVAPVRALASQDFRYEDRGKRALLTGDIETWITSMQFWPPGTRVEGDVFGTFGDRISLDRARWMGPPGGDTFEIERIRLIEIDDAGRLRAAIMFDPDDRTAASVEALRRFAAGEAAALDWRALIAVQNAWSQHDWTVMRAHLAPDFVYQDRRRIGLGTYDAEALIASVRQFTNLAPDAQLETIRILRWHRHGGVAIHRVFGTFSGGGPFEQVFATVALLAGNRIQRLEDFDLDDLDRALACFDELCATRAD